LTTTGKGLIIKTRKGKENRKEEKKMAIRFYGVRYNYNNYTYRRNPKGEMVKTYGFAGVVEEKKAEKKEEKK
jgi:hypothetical protein